MLAWLALLLAGCVAKPDIGGAADETPSDDTVETPSDPGDDDPATAPETDDPPPVEDTASASTTTDDSVEQLCVDEINDYRATLGLPAYGRWSDGEACAADEARQDSESGIAHGAFGQCGEWAQNECPGWPLPADSSIVGCLAMMWAEGPGADFSLHGHYINMSSESYSEVACGFYETPSGSLWAIQNFR